MTSEAIAAKDERIRELEEKLAKCESPNYSVVADLKTTIETLEKRNRNVKVIERQKAQELEQELAERDRTIAQLREELREQKAIAKQMQTDLVDRRNQDFTDCADIVVKLKKICPQKKVVDLRVKELQQAIELATKAELPKKEK